MLPIMLINSTEKTASGEKFHNSNYTAAHKKLPFGTKVKVTNIANEKSVLVEINDRGPFVPGREIDLTKKPLWKLQIIKIMVH